jgi:DNA-binding NarL/FixJ family response regulator
VALEADGFTTACAHLADIQNGTLDLLAFVHLHKPELIIYDLPRPYESHWNFLRLLKETDSLRTARWVLTTTDKKALEAAVGRPGSSRSSSVSRTASRTSWRPSARHSRSPKRD